MAKTKCWDKSRNILRYVTHLQLFVALGIGEAEVVSLCTESLIFPPTWLSGLTYTPTDAAGSP